MLKCQVYIAINYFFFADISEATITRVLELILPRLKEVHELTEKIKILDALDTWEMKMTPTELCTEYQELINNEFTLRKQMIKDTELLQRLHGVIIDLYVDWERARGSRR